jgi:hypothetical protein
MEQEDAMALFGRDYDRDYGYRGGTWNRDYDRNFRADWNRGDRDIGDRGVGNRDMGYWGGNRYDRDFGAMGYDRSYKSRWETDFGDPFGDRSARTPMRMIRGEYEGGDRGYQGANRYGRDYYEANPMGYDPYAGRPGYTGREGTWMRGYDRNYRTSGRGYDTGWF